MKNNYLKIVFAFCCFIMSSVGMAQSKVTICHVPIGNPAAAQTMAVSASVANNHLSATFGHRDFPGNCWSGCIADAVIKTTQGTRSNGSPVLASRSDVTKVLGIPDGTNNPNGFYSLGVGGEIIVRMDGGILNRPGNDLQIYESSVGQPDCSAFPQRAEIFVSQNMKSWTSRGIICQDGAIDIAPLDWIMYVKIKDVSNPLEFTGIVDGFHLDGIQCIKAVQKQAADAQTVFTIYPIPVSNNMNISFKGLKQEELLLIEVFNQTGKTVFSREMKTEGESGDWVIPMDQISQGVYSIRISGDHTNYSEQFIKK